MPAVRSTNRRALDSEFAGDAARSLKGEARSAERLAAGLGMIAGFVDAYGMITYGVFVSFMSGNTTQAGYQTAEGLFGPAARAALAILCFVVGTFVGTLLMQAAGRLARRAVFGDVAAALAEVVGLTAFGFLAAGFGIAVVSAAMGILNSAFSRVGAQPVSLTFVTGTLSRVGSHLALGLTRAPLANAQGPWDTHFRRALLLARVWVGFLAGALVSGAATPRFGVWVLMAPAVVLAALAAFDRPDPARAPKS